MKSVLPLDEMLGRDRTHALCAVAEEGRAARFPLALVMCDVSYRQLSGITLRSSGRLASLMLIHCKLFGEWILTLRLRSVTRWGAGYAQPPPVSSRQVSSR